MISSFKLNQSGTFFLLIDIQLWRELKGDVDNISTFQYSILLIGRLAQQTTYRRSWISVNNDDNSVNDNGSRAICLVCLVAMQQ